MKDNISLIQQAKTRKAFQKVMTQLNALDDRKILDELLKTKTEKTGKFEHEYSLLFYINEQISPRYLEKRYPKIYAAATLINTPQKIDLCNTIIAAMAEGDEKKTDRHCLTLGRFVREGLHPDLVSCDSLITSAKACDRHALILFKMGFAASQETCMLLAKKMICLTADEDATKVIDMLSRIDKRYPDVIQRDELFVEAFDQRNVAAINWLHDKREEYKTAKAQEKELQDFSFGKKKKKNKSREENCETNAAVEKKEVGIGYQLAARKDSPRNAIAEPGHALVNIAKEVLNECSM
ncbi:MAG TPA: hypothetical protein VGV92_05095 [Gammaproteobacteria bacterium]|nr:hypothetical protein [Gammaproteobacteria bacterium]